MGKKYLKNFTGRLIITAFFALVQIIGFIVSVVMLSTYAIPIYAALNFISLGVVILVVNRRQNPSFKLTWSILILTFPLFGGLMYIAAMLQGSTYRFKKRAESAHSLIEPYIPANSDITEQIRSKSRTMAAHASYLANKAGYPVYSDTEAEFLPTGDEFFEALKRELAKAEKFIFLEFFIIQEGVMWDNIMKILIDKARAGVDVRLIRDGMGCMTTLPKNYEAVLRSLGIKVMVFNPFIPLATVIQNNRDHRKIVVIDGHTAFTGGVNLADEYINAYERYGHWKDTMVMLRGEAVRSFTLMFLETWYFENPADENIECFLYKPTAHGFIRPQLGYVQPYADTPLDGECVGELVYFNLVNKAKDYIYIATPYLIPDNELVTALCFAAKSGIDVRIITPHVPDKRYVFQVTRSFYDELISAGVRIYEYTPGFVHQKTCVSDDSIAVVGSINFDYRSLYLHFECAALLYENPAVMEVKRDFLNMIESCEEITAEKSKRIRNRYGLSMSVLRLLAPLF